MKNIKVVYKKLKKVHGYAIIGKSTIEISTNISGKKLLEILIHEGNHLLFPDIEEDEIESKSIILCNMLWKQGFRLVDNSNDIPMQDGTK